MPSRGMQPNIFILVSRDLKVEFVNAGGIGILKDKTGLEIELGDNPIRLVKEENADFLVNQIKEGFIGRCFSFHSKLASNDSAGREVEIHLTPNLDERQEIIGLGLTIVFLEDSPGKLDFEAHLSDFISERKFEKLIEEGVEMISVLDHQAVFLSTSSSYFSILGYSPQELKGVDAFSLIHPDDFPQLYSEFQQVFTQKKVYSQPYRIRKKNGEYFWLKSIGTNLLDDSEIKGIVVISTDVNEMLVADQELKASELKYKFLFENNPAPMFVWDRDSTCIIATNERCQKLYGYTREEFLNLTILDIRPKEDYERLLGIAKEENKFSNFGKGSFKGISKHIKKSGELMDLEVNAQAINYEGKRASLVLIHDVTQQILSDTIEVLEFELMEEAIQAEIEVNKLLEKFLLGFENSIGGIRTSLMKVSNGKLINVASPQIGIEFLDYIQEDEIGPDKGCCGRVAFTGQRVFASDISQDHRWGEFKDYALAQGFKACYSIPILNSEKFVVGTFTVYFLEQRELEKEDFERHQRIASLISLILENDSRKEDLRVSNQRFEYVNLATNDALYDWDILSGNLFWGKSYERLLGFSHDNSEKMVVDWERRIHPEDLDAVTYILRKELNDPHSSRFKAEYRIRKNNGDYVHVVDRGVIVRDNSRKPQALIGALSDVTQQRKEETRLKLLESVITHANDAVVITEAEFSSSTKSRILYVNEAFSIMTGYLPEEVIGQIPRFLQPNRANSKELTRLREAMRSLRACEVTMINLRKNGEEFWVNFSLSPVADSDGLVTHWISIQREVTQQKIEEQRKDLLSRIVKVFANEERFNFALDQSLEQLVKFQDFDAGEIWLVNSDKSKMNLTSRYALTPVGSDFFKNTDKKVTFAPNVGLPGHIWMQNSMMIIHDLSISEIFARKEEYTKLKTAFGIPLHYNSQVIGAAIFLTQKKGAPFQSALKVFDGMSSMLGGEIIRKKAEDELSQIYDTAQDVISITGFDGMFKRVNQGMCRLLGYSEEEMLAHPIEYFMHPEDVEQSLNEFRNLKSGNNTLNYISRLLTKAGQTVWLEWNCTVVVEEELIYSVAKDISRQKELQNLLDSANKMAKIGFWDVDVINNTQYWTPITKEIHEVPMDFAVGVKEGMEFFVPEAKPIINEHFSRCIETGESYDLELQLITAKGNKIWIRTQGQAEFQSGKCKRVYGSIQDITALKQTQIHLKETLVEKDQILESIGDGFFSLDKDLRVTYWNQTAEKLLKLSKENILGRNLREVFNRGEAINSYQNYINALEKNAQVVFEDYQDELKAWFEVSVFPSKIGMSVYFKDITLRKTTEELIRQSNERFEKVAEATHEAIWDWDIVENKVYWGPGYESLFGLEPERPEITYDSWEALVHEDDLATVKNTVYDAMEDKSVSKFQNEYRFKKIDGSYASVIDRAVIIRDKNGNPIRMLGAIQDMSEQKEYETSLKNLNEKLEVRARELAASNAELEQFAYVASHDLQEPLRMVSSFLTQLENKYDSQLDERAKKYIFYAVDGAKRMRQIILDLLEYSRVGRSEGEKEMVNLEEIMAEVFKLQFNLIQSKKANVIWSDLPTFKGHRTQLLQLFQNLISNAIKYSNQAVPPEVQISCKDLGEYWEFAVVDNGIGIEADSFEKIFVIFQRLHTRDQFVGTGIGLAIVKKIVENFGGKIWVDSILGQGTTFRFTLKK